MLKMLRAVVRTYLFVQLPNSYVKLSCMYVCVLGLALPRFRASTEGLGTGPPRKREDSQNDQGNRTLKKICYLKKICKTHSCGAI